MKFAWPIAEIIFKKEINETEGHEAKLLGTEVEYADLFTNPYTTLQCGFVDEVKLTQETRRKLIKVFGVLENKERVRVNRKYGNILV